MPKMKLRKHWLQILISNWALKHLFGFCFLIWKNLFLSWDFLTHLLVISKFVRFIESQLSEVEKCYGHLNRQGSD